MKLIAFASFCFGAIIALGVVAVALPRGYAHAAALVTPTPEPLTCFLGPVRYDLVENIPPTPTRITVPTVTPLPEATPSATATVAATPSVIVRVVVNAVNVRACPGTTCAIIGAQAAGSNVSLSTAPADTVTLGASVWMRLAGAANKWISITAAGITR